jgi:hypothetical protein
VSTRYLLIPIEDRPRRQIGERIGAALVLVLLFVAAQACNRDADGYPADSPFPRASQSASPSAEPSPRASVMGWDTDCIPAAPPGTTCEQIGGHR